MHSRLRTSSSWKNCKVFARFHSKEEHKEQLDSLRDKLNLVGKRYVELNSELQVLERSLDSRSLLSARFYKPSCSDIIFRDNDHEEKLNYGSFLHQRSFSSSILSQHLISSSHLSLCAPFGVFISRSMSTSHVPDSDDTGNVNDVAGIPTDSVIENVVTQVHSDWSFSFDIVQPLIETVHSFTGLNWWASIVLTTFLVRGVTIPLMIDNEKWRSRSWMLGIHSTASMEVTDPATLAEHKIEFFKLLKKYGGIFSLSQVLYPLLQYPATVWIALTINDMTGKVASFKTGGALWFTDLTTPDALIFPLLTGFTFCIMVECDALVGIEGAMMPKKLTRSLVIPMFVCGISLSKAVHCYLMSSMLFSIAFMLVIRRPGVKKYFDIPEVPEHVALISYKRIFGKWL